MAVYFLATLGCALAPGIRSFLVFRFLEALGGSAGLVITRAMVRDLFDRQRAAKFLSSMALVMGLAPVLAPSMGSLIGGLLGWRAVFVVLALANAACMGSVFAFLPETGKPSIAALRLSSVIVSYGRLLRDRTFVGYLVPDTAIRAGMFAYIAGSSFVFIHLYHLSRGQYGWVFGLNGCGLMLASQVNRRLLKYFSPERILAWSVRGAALAAGLVFVSSWTGAPYPVVLVSISVFIATLNFVSPNSLASAMAPHGHQAGTASALYGSLQWSLATGSAFLVGYLHDGTALPMAGVMLGCGLVSLSAFRLLVTPTWRPERLLSGASR
jgi:DHA1 family bicyclomycin/chloramphenicol resistance-like MFS transporter